MQLETIQTIKTKDLVSWFVLQPKEQLPDLIELLLQDERRSVQQFALRQKRVLEKKAKEEERIRSMWRYEKQAVAQGYFHIAGTDEVGRGPLAGPVVAAAVILPEQAVLPGINDSKKLTESQREVLQKQIQEQAIAWAIAEVDAKIIDQINILEASRLAMQRAVEKLSVCADFVLVDGLPNPRIQLPNQAIVKGDSKSISIAAASILAKVYRDHLMEDYEKSYPGYGFAEHKGYPTEAHRNAITKLGPCAIHRKTFRPVEEIINRK